MADSTPKLAATALSLTVQDWNRLGLEDDPTFDATVERVTALLLVRIVALAVSNDDDQQDYSDFSTSTICRTALMQQEPWPDPITDSLILQLQQFVRVILQGYNDVPYHNFAHAYHVCLSTNKLIDLMWNKNNCSISATKSFGLREDALSLTALLFAALIHDVEHTGVPNRTLAAEDDDLAVLYNDQSIAEQRSLYVGFKEFLKDDYAELRQAMFPVKQVDYRHFRQQVINLVLNTDIASPERTQLAKSKWKEAFGGNLSRHYNSVSSFGGISLHDDDEDDDDDDNNDETKQQEESKDEEEAGMLAHVREEEGMLAHARNSMPMLSIHSGHGGEDELTMSRRRMMQRSLSVPAKSFRKRLGIRRSMDLSGEALEAFSSHSTCTSRNGNDDETDDLKATVVMETIMTAADVAHNLQGWDQMVKWSGRLYLELRKAHVAGRGADPQPKWFENQIGFLESYLLPLAQRLDDTGVFGHSMGAVFATTVKENRDRWLLDGIDVTEHIIQEGATVYPTPN